VSLDYTTEQMQKIEKLIQPLRDSGEIRSTSRTPARTAPTTAGSW
jgi:HAE1 family hydrophobic/amphiphilic exporter-1